MFLTLGFSLLKSSAQPAFDLLHLYPSMLLVNRNTHRSLASRGAGRAAWGPQLRHKTFTVMGGSPKAAARAPGEVSHPTQVSFSGKRGGCTGVCGLQELLGSQTQTGLTE